MDLNLNLNLDRLHGPVLSLFRMVVGLLFFFHGMSTIFGVFGPSPELDVGEWPGWWAALIQVVCGGLVLIGLLTRYAAVLASGSMAYAYFTVHLPEDILPLYNQGEAAAMFSWSFLLIAVFGPGPWALDALLFRRAGVLHIPAPVHLHAPIRMPKQGRAERPADQVADQHADRTADRRQRAHRR